MQVENRRSPPHIADILVFSIGLVATLILILAVSTIAGLAALGIGRAIGESESSAHIQEGFAIGVVMMLVAQGIYLNLRRPRQAP